MTGVPFHKKVVSADQECHEMRGSTGVTRLGHGPQGWECRPEQRQRPREKGVLTERTQRDGDSEALAKTIRAAVPRRRTARRERGERAHRNKKKGRGEHTDIQHSMLSSTRRATLSTSGGPITDVRVV